MDSRGTWRGALPSQCAACFLRASPATGAPPACRELLLPGTPAPRGLCPVAFDSSSFHEERVLVSDSPARRGASWSCCGSAWSDQASVTFPVSMNGVYCSGNSVRTTTPTHAQPRPLLSKARFGRGAVGSSCCYAMHRLTTHSRWPGPAPGGIATRVGV